ncbi:hypothetical protein F183_A38130 [Bryobacterales bacterium F-183]|nr:hypothetical protein F183_A38130 [Bryobacterales bacterium F-183]
MTPLRRIVYPALLVLVTLAFHWKLLFTGGRYTWLNAPDFAHQLLPWYQFQASEWHAGRLPLWTPYEWAGQSLLGQAQPGVLDPLNLFLYLLPLNQNGWLQQSSLEWFYALGYVCGVLSCYAFARFGLLLSPPASAFTALAFSLGGIPSSTAWPQMMHASIWAPLGYLFIFRASRHANPQHALRDGSLSGLFLGVMWLSGHHQQPLFFTLAAIGLWLWFLYARSLRLFPAAVLSGLFLFLFAAPQVLPMVEYGRTALRWAGAADMMGWNDKLPYQVHEQFSASGLTLLGLVLPISVSYPAFMGITTVSLAFAGAFATWTRRTEVRVLAALALAGTLYALGANSFLQGTMYALLPAIEKARVPGVAMVLCNLGLASLAGFGIDALRNGARQVKNLALPLFLIGLTCATIAAYQYVFRSWENWTFITPAIAASIGAYAIRRNARWAPIVLAAAVLCELSSFTPSIWADLQDQNRTRFVEGLADHTDVALYLRSVSGGARFDHNADDIPYSFGGFWGLEAAIAIVPSVPADLWTIGPFGTPVRDFLSIRYDVGKKKYRPDQEEIYRSPKSGIAIYENPNSFPRAWLVHNVQPVADLKAVGAWMNSAGDRRKQEAVVTGETSLPQVDTCDTTGESAVYTSRTPNQLRLQIKANCRALLVLNDQWDAGWTSSTKVWKVDGFVRGIEVAKGKQEVVLTYRPKTALAGAGLFGIGILGIAYVLFRYKQPEQPR